MRQQRWMLRGCPREPWSTPEMTQATAWPAGCTVGRRCAPPTSMATAQPRYWCPPPWAMALATAATTAARPTSCSWRWTEQGTAGASVWSRRNAGPRPLWLIDDGPGQIVHLYRAGVLHVGGREVLDAVEPEALHLDRV